VYFGVVKRFLKEKKENRWFGCGVFQSWKRLKSKGKGRSIALFLSNDYRDTAAYLDGTE
jgi:hypothetical protein